jgi:hypothetical protein
LGSSFTHDLGPGRHSQRSNRSRNRERTSIL